MNRVLKALAPKRTLASTSDNEKDSMARAQDALERRIIILETTMQIVGRELSDRHGARPKGRT